MRKINLRGISEVLSDRELRNVLGGSGIVVVTYECCIDDGTGDSPECFIGMGLCAGPDCETCMGYKVAQSGFECWNRSCSSF